MTADRKTRHMRHRVMFEWPSREEGSGSGKVRSKSCHNWVKEGALPTYTSFLPFFNEDETTS